MICWSSENCHKKGGNARTLSQKPQRWRHRSVNGHTLSNALAMLLLSFSAKNAFAPFKPFGGVIG